MMEQDIIGFDVETSGLYSSTNVVASYQFYFPLSGETLFLPVRMKNLPEDVAAENRAKAKDIIMRYKVVGHNLMFDSIFTSLDMNVLPYIAGDSAVLASMAQIPDKKLKELVVEYEIVTQEEVVLLKDVAPDNDFTQLDYTDNDAVEYACNDAKWAFLLEKKLREKWASLIPSYEDELQNIRPFAMMSCTGILFDHEKFVSIRKAYSETTDKLKDEMNDEAGFDFRVRSSADMDAVWAKLKLPEPGQKTPKGKPSYSKESLKFVNHPFVAKLRDYSGMFSASGTMSDFEKYYKNKEGRYFYLRPFYRTVGDDGTSRVYTTNPSTNQLPKEIREAMIPHKGKKFIYFDWSSAELMVMAYWAGEQTLIDLYEAGTMDFHSAMASKLFGIPIDQVSKEQRETSKVVTFSVLYGSEGGAASRALGISLTESSKLVEKFWETYPKMNQLRKNMIAQAHHTGSTFTITGRRRRLPLLNSRLDEEVAGARRQAVNTAIQGSVADLQKHLIRRTFALLIKQFQGRFVTTVFDSFLVEVPEEVCMCDIQTMMDSASKFSVGGVNIVLKAKYKEGHNYLEASTD
jgi:DNA polymerase-1